MKKIPKYTQEERKQAQIHTELIRIERIQEGLIEKPTEPESPLVALILSEIANFVFAFLLMSWITWELFYRAEVRVTFTMLGCAVLIFIFSITIDQNQNRWGEFDESSWAPCIIKATEIGGACISVWAWLSPDADTTALFAGVFLVVLGGIASLFPMSFSAPEKTLFATLFMIKRGSVMSDKDYELLFQDKEGEVYSFFTSDTLNLSENSPCTLTVRGRKRKVLRFTPMPQPRIVEELPS